MHPRRATSVLHNVSHIGYRPGRSTRATLSVFSDVTFGDVSMQASKCVCDKMCSRCANGEISEENRCYGVLNEYFNQQSNQTHL